MRLCRQRSSSRTPSKSIRAKPAIEPESRGGVKGITPFQRGETDNGKERRRYHYCGHDEGMRDLLGQKIELGDVQTLAGHADPRTTRLYDRSERKVTRNLVERIKIGR